MSDGSFVVDSYFVNHVNEHCELPGIDEQTAFNVWYSAEELVRAIAGLRRLIPELGSRELSALVRSVSQDITTGNHAATVVRMIANTQALSA